MRRLLAALCILGALCASPLAAGAEDGTTSGPPPVRPGAAGGASSPGASGATSPALSSSETSAVRGALEEVTFTHVVVPEPVRLGQPFRYEMRFQGPAGTHLFFPPKPAMGDLHLDDSRCVEARPGDPSLDTTCTLSLRAFRLGRVKLPAIEVAWSRAGTPGGTLKVPEKRLEVEGNLANEASPSLNEAYTLFTVEQRNWPLIVGAVLLLSVVATAALTLLVVLVLRRYILPRRFEKPRPPAHVIAFGRLEGLRAGLQGAEPPGREWFFELSEIVREYLGHRYGFESLELTTRELMNRLAGAELQGVNPMEIEDFLSFSDLIKFARQAADRQEAERLFEAAHGLVTRTLFIPPEKPAEDLKVPEFAHAPLAERLAAFLADLALTLPLPLLARAVAPEVPAWVLALGWLGLLLAWLVARDLLPGGSPGHRLFGHLLLDEALDLRAPWPARARRNAPLLLPLIGWTVEGLVAALVTRNQRIGDQWAHVAVACRSGRPAHRWLAMGVAALALAAWTATALWLAGRP